MTHPSGTDVPTGAEDLFGSDVDSPVSPQLQDVLAEQRGLVHSHPLEDFQKEEEIKLSLGLPLSKKVPKVPEQGKKRKTDETEHTVETASTNPANELAANLRRLADANVFPASLIPLLFNTAKVKSMDDMAMEKLIMYMRNGTGYVKTKTTVTVAVGRPHDRVYYWKNTLNDSEEFCDEKIRVLLEKDCSLPLKPKKKVD
uniref:Uncharacterized protein n=1 Tax=Chromera velia CCMP2878 TaxID=1169474 RepID=A0A0G4GY54_9ALVE|eukprot:Cvel_5381.t1-p1 / transcript=Cvel_5381.t1 / gene=Cvel_5381 / organism=Chromera_velia_CCMP2878 / gene_product=hypothetical protein / transcript_product=hypothetical protein / location=Cvel_scaffold250:60035-60754(-) / protein_length=199 / sequence_SO=supercontig / SO=protein_coding / is_pseudo=false